MKLRSKHPEPIDAREAFHKSERQHKKQEIMKKWISRLFLFITIAIIAFALYAYFIDKPEAILSHP
jgi:hypothetical protein